MNILWSPKAKDTYIAILQFLSQNYPLDVLIEFDDKVENLIQQLKSFKNLCPPSKQFPDFRKCVINKQHSLIYSISKDAINIIAFTDNRSQFST